MTDASRPALGLLLVLLGALALLAVVPPGATPAARADGDGRSAAEASGAAAAETVHLKLLATNDIHGQLHPPQDGLGGAAYLATHLERIKEDHPATLHVDTGDAAGGSGGLSRRLGYEPTIEAFNAMGLDVQALGNHEFDHGREQLERRYAGGCWHEDCGYRGGEPFDGAAWQPLVGNVLDAATGEPLYPGTWTTEVAGVRVGVIGVTTTDLIPEEGNEDLERRAWYETINPLAEDLADDVDVVVVLRHVGTNQGGDVDACPDWTGAAARFVREDLHEAVDVVVDGHTHRAYVCDQQGVALTTQALEHTLMFTEIDLHVDPERGEVVDRSATNRWVTHDVPPHPGVLDIIDHATTWTTGTLTGTVTAAESGEPLQDATVHLGGEATTTTDAEGAFTFEEVFAGQQAVAATADDLQPAFASAQIAVGETTTVDLALDPEPETGAVLGTVTDLDSGQPVPDATVSLGDGTSTTTDAEGSYTLQDVEPGTVTVTAAADGYTAAEQDGVEVIAGDATTVDLALAPAPGRVSGTISGEDGPLAGATVRLGERRATTGADGTYALAGVAPGTYELVADHEDHHASEPRPVEVAADAALDVDVVLEPLPTACPEDEVRDAGFTDVSNHEHAVNCLAGWGITQGVGDGSRFAPAGLVTRAQMASFLERAIERSGGWLPAADDDRFSDVDGGAHATAINRLARAGVVGGYPDGTYRPAGTVTRGQMATFLGNAFEHRTGTVLADPPPSGLADVRGGPHETRIEQAVAQGWAQGYADRTYRPNDPVRRDHMALFLTRWLDTLAREHGATYPG